MSEIYKDLSQTLFASGIKPVIEGSRDGNIDDYVKDYTLMQPEKGTRFYPSVLSLITGLSGNPRMEINDAVLKPAAAIELFHNSTLIHDDVIDRHEFRRNQPTIYSRAGGSAALLAGSYAVGEAFRLIGESGHPRTPELTALLGRAVKQVNLGQYNDEGSVWDTVPPENLFEHWKLVAEQKTIAGIVACEFGGVYSDTDPKLWYTFEAQLGIMSQVINDTGDIWDFTGYVETEKSKRTTGGETELKYTLPRIWYLKTGRDLLAETDMKKALKANGYVDYATVYMKQLRTNAHQALVDLRLPNSTYRDTLVDFINAPKLPAYVYD